jgi:hypothetical protein
MYIGFYNNSTENMAMVLTRGDEPAMVQYNFSATASYVDRATGKLYVCSAGDNNIYQLDADPLNKSTFEWKSKRFSMPRPMNFSCIQVNADFDSMDDVDTYNETVEQVTAGNQAKYDYAVANGPLYGEWNWAMWNTYPYNGSSMVDVPDTAEVRYVTVIVYADGKQVFSAPITSLRPVRMPAGFTAHHWEIYLSGNANALSVTMATSMTELKEA